MRIILKATPEDGGGALLGPFTATFTGVKLAEDPAAPHPQLPAVGWTYELAKQLGLRVDSIQVEFEADEK